MPNRTELVSPKQPRSQVTIQMAIEATDRAILRGGEGAVRIQEISDETGVSIGSLYHHFGDRDGLIRATYVERFAKTVREDLAALQRWTEGLQSKQQMSEQYDKLLAFLKHHFENQSALDRAAIVGNTAGRPELHEALAEVQHELTQSLAEVMQTLKDRGVLKEFLDPYAAASVVLGLIFGRVIAELDTRPFNEHDWSRAVLAAFSGLVREG